MFPCMEEAFQSNGSFPQGRNPTEAQALRSQAYREFPGEFACIKLEQNTNQHEMQRAEVFLSHVHTHTHTQSKAGQHTFDRQDSGNPVLATVCFFTVG